MKRKDQKQEEVPRWKVYTLTTGYEHREAPPAAYVAWSEKDQKATWRKIRQQVVKDWVRETSGCRPWGWWLFDAPEPRRRLGGTGTPAHEVLNQKPSYWFGLPDDWVTQFDVEFYNGRAKDIHGNIIPTPFKDGDFSGQAIDPEDPPIFESQAAYLKRHNLFLPGEEELQRPESFEPEVYIPDEEN